MASPIDIDNTGNTLPAINVKVSQLNTKPILSYQVSPDSPAAIIDYDALGGQLVRMFVDRLSVTKTTVKEFSQFLGSTIGGGTYPLTSYNESCASVYQSIQLDPPQDAAVHGEEINVTLINGADENITITLSDDFVVDPTAAVIPITAGQWVLVKMKFIIDSWVVLGRITSEGVIDNGSNLTYRGAYNNVTNYVINDVVFSGTSSYVCVLNSTGHTPPNATYWGLLAVGGSDGSTGIQGLRGTNAGFKYVYDTATTGSGAPASGHVRFNSGSGPAASTVMFVNKTTADSSNISAVLTRMGDNCSRVVPQFWLTKDTDPSVYVIFAVYQPPTDAGAYESFAVILPLASAGSFSNGDSVRLDFRPMGAQAGFQYQYSSDTGSGTYAAKSIKFDSTTIASISYAYIAVSDLLNNTLTSEIESWDDSTNTVKGLLKVTTAGDSTKFATFQVTGSISTPSAGFRKVFLTPVAAGTVWSSSGDIVRVEFTRAGDA